MSIGENRQYGSFTKECYPWMLYEVCSIGACFKHWQGIITEMDYVTVHMQPQLPGDQLPGNEAEGEAACRTLLLISSIFNIVSIN